MLQFPGAHSRDLSDEPGSASHDGLQLLANWADTTNSVDALGRSEPGA